MRWMYRGLLTIVLLLFHVAAWAQCAMCRATLENNVSEGDIGIAAKLNVGILYLFAMPYLLAVVIGFLWYRYSKRNSRKLAMAERIKDRIQSIHAR